MTDTIDRVPPGDDLEARLVATLRAKAGQLPSESDSFVAGAFVPGERAFVRPLDGGHPSARRTRRTAWLVAAAAVVVLVVLGATVWIRSEDQSRTVTVPPGALATSGAPSWVPDGYELVDARIETGPDQAAVREVSVQAFGADGRPDVLIEIGGVLSAFPEQPTSPPVSVRGNPARVWLPSEGQPQPEDTATASYSWAATQLTWEESGTTIRATFRDLGLDEALGMLDGVVWRVPGSALSGFDPAGFAPMDLIDETLSSRASGVGTSLSYSSARPPHAPFDLEVLVIGAPGPVDAYYRMWAENGRAADGDVEVTSGLGADSPPDVARRVEIRWPDGRGVTVESPTIAADELERVARSIHAATPDDIDALQADASVRLLAYPTVASALLPSGSVSLHEVGVVDAICFAPENAPPACRVTPFVPPVRTVAWADSLIGGRWFVFAAGPSAPVLMPAESGQVPLRSDPSSSDTASFMASLPIEQAQDGPVHLVLVEVPTDIGHLAVGFVGLDGGDYSYVLSRPD